MSQAEGDRLLSAVAASLNACEAAGLAVRLKHGAVLTEAGFVLPVAGHRWAARTLAYTEFGLIVGEDDD